MKVSLSHFEKDIRPWGQYERFSLSESTTVKIISVSPNEAFSLQTHAHRKEFWRILSGSGTITIGETRTEAKAGDQFMADMGEKHRAEAGPEGLQFLEIAFGEFDENDIIRLEDRYGRT
jgi:mannose-1-phosphate guanylyltransferase/mannose-1-phosphate guanylyltransferase/mannose-6-phosphate isomerase